MNSPKSAPRKSFNCGFLFDDPIVQEVRAIRHDLAAKLGNDLHQIANDLMSRQARLGRRLRATHKNHVPELITPLELLDHESDV